MGKNGASDLEKSDTEVPSIPSRVRFMPENIEPLEVLGKPLPGLCKPVQRLAPTILGVRPREGEGCEL